MSMTEDRKAAILKALNEFYTPGNAEAFMMEPQRLLSDRKPIDMIRTEAGFRKLMEVIERLRDGAYI